MCFLHLFSFTNFANFTNQSSLWSKEQQREPILLDNRLLPREAGKNTGYLSLISVPKYQNPFPLVLVKNELGAVSESFGLR